MNLSNLVVFDIETIPDHTVCKNLLGLDNISPSIGREALQNYHLDITNGKNSFSRQLFHKVVAISFVEAEISYSDGRYQNFSFKEVRSGGKSNYSEKELLRSFFNFFSHKKPRLVSFNGRTFDLPVLKYRAMMHGIECEYLYHSGDKWSNYSQRYSKDWHCDLLQVLSDYGASATVKLDEVCALFGLPGKAAITGADVPRLFDENRLDDIRNYCESDVLNTYLVYLRMMLHQGILRRIDYRSAIEDLVTYLREHGVERKHLLEFYNDWDKACSGNFFIDADIVEKT